MKHIFCCLILGCCLTACWPQNKKMPVLVPLDPALNKNKPIIGVPDTVKRGTYEITYGSSTAPYHCVDFFDIGCEQCVNFYRDHFPTIQKKWIDTGKLRFTFKPYPVQAETLVFMACCETLTTIERQLLFETLMEVKTPSVAVIEQCMKVLKKPFQTPTVAVLKATLLITKIHKFDALPVLFFDHQRLNDAQQDGIIHFLEEVLT